MVNEAEKYRCGFPFNFSHLDFTLMRLSIIAEFEAAATRIAAKIAGNFEAADKAKLERVVSDTISWFDRSCASG